MAAREAAKEVSRAPRGEGISRMRGPRGKEPIETIGDKAAIEKGVIGTTPRSLRPSAAVLCFWNAVAQPVER
ncbi:hypothetical protein OPV22_005388 [Ensete ventricosum]|uniref:Uncharacterized protein n=1 Tax=Ensete ventricosum TaxID=4639 RepID=A0AAV8Q8Y8_ENSVE|nr:hypothetical protein OPV22_005388 [Ensete ventricosum]